MAREVRAWLDERRIERLDVFHLQGVGVGVLEEARALGVPAVFHATDFFVACPIATLTLADGTACDGPPDGGLGCLGCIHTGVGERIRAEGLEDDVKRLTHAAGGAHLNRPLLGGLAAALVGRREAIAASVSRAAAVAAPSKFLLETLARHGVARAKLRHVPYGLDLTRLQGLTDRPAAGPVVFGYFGTLAPHKGALPLVQAFRGVKGDARLLLRGKEQEFPDYGAAVRREASQDPRVELRGPFATGELGAALSEIDALVVPSLWHENTPFVALEALAARRPVIAFDKGGLAEIVGCGRGGALVKPGDEAALTAALERFRDRAVLARVRAEIGAPRTVAAALDDIDALLGA
jgi:glycosyltransferase involved in cell wall biosynthesis